MSGVAASSARRVLLLVPHRVRDLEGDALLAYHLERTHGVETHVSNIADFDRKVFEVEPDAVILDYLGWSSKARTAEVANRLGMKVAVLPVAGLWETEAEHLRAAGQSTGGNRFVDSYLAWGDLNRRILVSGGLFPPDRVHVTGCPRFDLYHEPYRSLEPEAGDPRGRLGIPADAPLILWATSTPNFARDRKAMLREATVVNGLTPERAEENLREEQRQFEQNSALVAELARRRPDWQFVIKVHPIEPVSSYADLDQAYPNVHVVYADAIRAFLTSCRVLLQRSCTTAMEAWMLGRPVLELAVEGSTRGWAPSEFLAGNHLVRGVDEAEAALAGYVAGEPVPEAQRRARENFLTDCFGPQDGRAAVRCAQRIADLVSPEARSEADRARTRQAVREAIEANHCQERGRLSSRLKRTFAIPESVPLRFWKRRSTALPKIAEREVTPEMVSGLHARFDALLAQAPPDAEHGSRR